MNQLTAKPLEAPVGIGPNPKVRVMDAIDKDHEFVADAIERQLIALDASAMKYLENRIEDARYRGALDDGPRDRDSYHAFHSCISFAW